MKSVIVIDMHIRDERALEFLMKNSINGLVLVKTQDIADAVKCTKKTAIQIVKRLAGAGKIERKLGGKGRGDVNTYRIIAE